MQQQWRRSGKRKDRMKLSLPPKLIVKGKTGWNLVYHQNWWFSVFSTKIDGFLSFTPPWMTKLKVLVLFFFFFLTLRIILLVSIYMLPITHNSFVWQHAREGVATNQPPRDPHVCVHCVCVCAFVLISFPWRYVLMMLCDLSCWPLRSWRFPKV
jgi:hypothetical protein